MKRLLSVIVLLLISNTVFGLTNTLIDFTQLGADYPSDAPKQNQRTLLNFSAEAGSTFTDEEKELMLTSLALNNWRVKLASSSATIIRQANSYTKEARTSASADDFEGEDMKSKTILGVRVTFPESNFNSYAIVKPPFEIQAYQDKLTVGSDGSLTISDDDKGKADMFEGFGVIKNVGTIKDIQLTAYGANYPHAVEIILQNENYEQHSYHITYLDYEGWGTRTWTNPDYISDVRNRQIKKYVLYPRSVPYVKFIGFVLYRDANAIGGDFITYFKNIKITYDEAIKDLDNPQIDDETIWNILDDRNQKRRQSEYKRLGSRQVLELLEEQKRDGYVAPSNEATTPPATE